MGNNNGINSQILTSMQTHYNSLLKDGAATLGTVPMSTSVFNKIDKDKNGKLTQNEIDAAMPSMGQIIKDAAAGAKEFAVKLFGGNQNSNTPEPSEPVVQNQDTTFNGKVDKDFKQGQTGDCWLLAAIAAMAETPEGREKLNNMLSIDENNNITVNLNGIKIMVSKEELEANDKLASGDLDVRAFEYAFREYLDDDLTKRLHKESPIDGGSTGKALNILLGGGVVSTDVNDDLINKIKEQKNYIVVATNEKKIVHERAFDEDNNIVKLFNTHVYAAIGADDRYVYLKNPHDTSKTLKITHDDFKSAFDDAGVRAKNKGTERITLNPLQESDISIDFLK